MSESFVQTHSVVRLLPFCPAERDRVNWRTLAFTKANGTAELVEPGLLIEMLSTQVRCVCSKPLFHVKQFPEEAVAMLR